MGDVVDLDAYRKARQEREKRRRRRRHGADVSGGRDDATSDSAGTTGTDGADDRGSPKPER
jgi:hypothetical protein